MTKLKRGLASVLTALMLITMLPAASLAAEPAETTEPDLPVYTSMLPLEEHRFEVDFTKKLPAELEKVPVKEIFAGSEYSLKDSDMVSWSRESYSESDDFVTIDANGTVDISQMYSYSDRVTLTLIVGTADQLNPNNIRYIVDVKVTPMENLLVFDAATQARQKIEVYNHNNYYSNDGYMLDGKEISVYQVSTNPVNYKYGDTAYVSINFGEDWKDAGLTADVYNGYYRTQGELPASAITDSIWSQSDLTAGGGFLGTYEYVREDGAQALTLVLKRGETVAQVLPFYLYMYPGTISVSANNLYAQDGENKREYVVARHSWDRKGDVDVETMTLYAGYPANGTYYLNLYLHNPAVENNENNGIAYVKAAYVGKYDTEAAAAGQTDIKAQLFSNAYQSGGYAGNFSGGVTFTVFDTAGGVHQLTVKTEAGTRELSGNTSFNVHSARPANGEEYSASYEGWDMPNEADSYYGNGFRTLFLLNSDGTPVTDSSIIPSFSSSSKSNVYAGAGGVSGTLQESGKTAVTFQSGQAVPYTVAAENGVDAKNYWVTFVTQHQGGAKLYVNGTNVDSLKDNGMPVREIFLTEGYDGDHHDIFIANIGDQPLTGLKVTLANAQNIKLDSYWTVAENSVKELAAFDSKTLENNYSDHANNAAKIRLLPDGEGMISGTLTISAGNGDSVSIKLTGLAGDPQIITSSVVEGVKWVPYSSIIQTNYMYGSSDIKFTLKDGELPEGLVVKPSGEIYGNPQEMGEFSFEVAADMSIRSSLRGNLAWSDTAEFKLVIQDNTNENVWNATDQNYDVTTAIPNTDGTLTITNMNAAQNSWSDETQIFLSQGQFADFIDLWLDGAKLQDGVDYEKDEGSTRLTIRTRTLRNKDTGTHTLSMEFREGDKELGTLKRAAQNYVITSSQSSKPGQTTKPGQPSTPTWTPGSGEYTVVSGDTLAKIAKKTLGDSTKWRDIYEVNKSAIKNPNQIYVGQKLVIPGTTTEPVPETPSTGATGSSEYVVVSGDSLWRIAQKTLGSGRKWNIIYEANQDVIRDPNKISVGQKLTIPMG